MFIAIAGSIGAGKSTIAHAVADRMGIPLHSLDDDKLAEGATHPDFALWVSEGIPFPDDFRRRAFARCLDQLSELAAVHDHVIVEETFHRRSIREPFFRTASDILGGMVLVEIVVDRDVALEHLARRASAEEDHMAGRAMFEAFRTVADPLEDPDFRVTNNGDLAGAVDAVCAYLSSRLRTHNTA